MLQALANFWQHVQTHDIMLHISETFGTATVFHLCSVQQHLAISAAPLYSLQTRRVVNSLPPSFTAALLTNCPSATQRRRARSAASKFDGGKGRAADARKYRRERRRDDLQALRSHAAARAA
jgi:hypothetical protein